MRRAEGDLGKGKGARARRVAAAVVFVSGLTAPWSKEPVVSVNKTNLLYMICDAEVFLLDVLLGPLALSLVVTSFQAAQEIS